MRCLPALLLTLVPLITHASDRHCQASIFVFGNQEIRVQIDSADTDASLIKVRLYAADKLVRSAIVGKNGKLAIGVLTEGKYRLVVDGWGTVKLEVRPGRGLNPPTSFLTMPRPSGSAMSGKKVIVTSCPPVVEIAN